MVATCSWFAPGRQCRMPASVASGNRCSWHDACANTMARMADNFEEFERWCTRLLEAHYCAVWTHYPPAVIWNAIQGRPRLPVAPTPTGCRQAGCQYHLEVEPVAALTPGRPRRGEAQPVGELVPAWVTGE